VDLKRAGESQVLRALGTTGGAQVRDLLSDTFHALAAHKRRTALTMFGIAWGIISITLMVAAGEGLAVGFERKKAEFGRDIMIVWAGRTSLQAGGTRAGRQLRWTATDHLQVQREAPSCRHVMPELGQDDVPIRSSYNDASLLVTASLPPFAEIRSIEVAEGRYPSWEDEAAARRVALLGSEAKKQLFGSRPALGETIRLGDFPYTVVGVMRHKEEDSNYDGPDRAKVYVALSALLRDRPKPPPQRPDAVDRLLATPRSLEDHEACKAEVRRALARRHGFDPRDKEAAGIWDTVEQAKAFRRLTDGMRYFLGAVGIATLFIGAIGVMNVMLVAVRERTREIGVRRALGATRRSILRLFFVETLLVVFASGGLGLAVAYGLCALVNLLPPAPYFAGLLPTWQSGVGTFLLLSTVALLAAVYPARRAADVDPIEALRFEAGG
jgi:putative ABC transport system permease protein